MSESAVSHVTLFRPVLQIAGDLPHWMSQLPASLSQMLAIRLSEQPTCGFVMLAKCNASATTPDNPLNQYDYTQLTSGRVVLHAGDFAVHTRFLLNLTESKLFSKQNTPSLKLKPVSDGRRRRPDKLKTSLNSTWKNTSAQLLCLARKHVS